MPCRDRCFSGPDSTAVTRPPTPTAVVNSPSVRGSPPNRAALIAGNSETGRPKNVALRSARNAPASAGAPPRRPAAQEAAATSASRSRASLRPSSMPLRTCMSRFSWLVCSTRIVSLVPPSVGVNVTVFTAAASGAPS